jgi:hypothetical protein
MVECARHCRKTVRKREFQFEGVIPYMYHGLSTSLMGCFVSVLVAIIVGTLNRQLLRKTDRIRYLSAVFLPYRLEFLPVLNFDPLPPFA